MLKRYLIPILLLLISGEFSLAGSPCYNLQITELSSRQALLFGVEVELERLSEVIEEASEVRYFITVKMSWMDNLNC